MTAEFSLPPGHPFTNVRPGYSGYESAPSPTIVSATASYIGAVGDYANSTITFQGFSTTPGDWTVITPSGLTIVTSPTPNNQPSTTIVYTGGQRDMSYTFYTIRQLPTIGTTTISWGGIPPSVTLTSPKFGTTIASGYYDGNAIYLTPVTVTPLSPLVQGITDYFFVCTNNAAYTSVDSVGMATIPYPSGNAFVPGTSTTLNFTVACRFLGILGPASSPAFPITVIQPAVPLVTITPPGSTTTSITLSWTQATPNCTFTISAGGGTTLTPTTNPFTITSVSPGTYSFQVGATLCGLTTYSATATTTVAPRPPSSFTATDNLNNSVTLAWSGQTAGSQMNLTWNGTATGSSNNIGNSPFNLSIGCGTYSFTLVSLCGGITSGSVSVNNVNVTPSTPTNFQQSVFGSTATLSWSEATPGCQFTLTSSPAIGVTPVVTGNTAVYSGIAAGTYTITLQSLSAGLNSVSSVSTQIVVSLAAPTNFSARSLGSKITLNWTGTTAGATFSLSCTNNSAFGTQTIPAGVFTASYGNVSTPGIYTFSIVSVLPGNNVSAPVTVSGQIVSTPADFKAVSTGSTINLNWTQATTGSTFSLSSSPGVPNLSITGNTATSTGATPGKYTFNLSAFTSGGSFLSTTISTATQVISTPNAFSASFVAPNVILTWSSATANCTFTLSSSPALTNPAPTTSLTAQYSAPLPGNYTFSVTAADGSGNTSSPASTTQTVTPPSPSNLAYTAMSPTAFTITFSEELANCTFGFTNGPTAGTVEVTGGSGSYSAAFKDVTPAGIQAYTITVNSSFGGILSTGNSSITARTKPNTTFSSNALCTVVGGFNTVSAQYIINNPDQAALYGPSPFTPVSTSYTVKMLYSGTTTTPGVSASSPDLAGFYTTGWWGGGYGITVPSAFPDYIVPPTMGTVTVSGTTITVPWTDSTTGSLTYAILGTTLSASGIAAGTQTKVFTGATVGTEYSFTITTGSGYVTANSATSTAVKPIAAPTNLSAAATGTTVNMSWSYGSLTGITFNVFDQNGNTRGSTGLTATNTSFTVSDSTAYTFTVQAIAQGGNVRATSGGISVTTVPAPSITSVVETGSTLTITCGTPASGTLSVAQTLGTSLTVGNTTNPFTYTGAAANTSYGFTVTNTGTKSINTAASNITTMGQPTFTKSDASGQSVILQWSYPTGAPAVTSYSVFPSGSTTAVVTGVTSLSYTFIPSGVTPPLVYKVVAIGAVGTGIASENTDNITPLTSATIGNPGATSTDGTNVTVAWTYSTTNTAGVTFKIYDPTLATLYSTYSYSAVSSTYNNTFSTNLTKNSTYSFVVVTTNLQGDTAVSGSTANVTLLTAPVVKTINQTGGEILVTLSAQPTITPAPYTPYYTIPSISPTGLTLTTSTATTFTYSGATSATAYTFSIQNNAGTGAPNSTNTTTELFTALSTPVAGSIAYIPGTTSISASWTYGGTVAGTQFILKNSDGSQFGTVTGVTSANISATIGTTYTLTVTASSGGNVSFPSSAFSSVTAVIPFTISSFVQNGTRLIATVSGSASSASTVPSLGFPSVFPGTPTLWLDAADPNATGIPADNGAIISSWKDKSGLGCNATATGTPTIISSGLNGRPAMNFNGSSWFKGATANTTSNLTVFAVVMLSVTNPANNSRIVSLATPTTNDYTTFAEVLALEQKYNGTPIATGRNTYPLGGGTFNFVEAIDYSTTINVPYIAAALYSGTSLTQTLFVNGLSKSTNSTIGAFGYTSYGIGNYSAAPDAGSEPFVGKISEVIVFREALTTNQRKTIEYYLAQKWGLPGVAAIAGIPTFIGSPVLWLDGADPAGNGALPGTVTTWVDKSGLGNNATSQSGSIAVTGNGLSFDGTSKYLTVPGIAGSLSGTPFVVFAVETYTGGTSSNTFYFGDDSNAQMTDSVLNIGYRKGVSAGGTGAYTFGFWNNDLNDTNVNITTTGVTRIWTNYLPGTANRTIRRNGAVDATYTTSTQLKAFAIPVIGRAFTSNYYTGFISELLVYKTDIGLPAIQTIEYYLSQKWGVPGPAVVPYGFTGSPLTFTFNGASANTNYIVNVVGSGSTVSTALTTLYTPTTPTLTAPAGTSVYASTTYNGATNPTGITLNYYNSVGNANVGSSFVGTAGQSYTVYAEATSGANTSISSGNSAPIIPIGPITYTKVPTTGGGVSITCAAVGATSFNGTSPGLSSTVIGNVVTFANAPLSGLYYIVTITATNATGATNSITVVEKTSFAPGSIPGLSMWYDAADITTIGYRAITTPPVASLQFWLDFADGTNLSAPGGNLTKINDKSGNNYTATAASTVDYSSTTKLVHFHNGQYLNIPQASINGVVKWYMFMVIKPVNLTSSWILAKQDDNVDSVNMFGIGEYANKYGFPKSATSGTLTFHNTDRLTPDHLELGVLTTSLQILSIGSEGTNLKFYVNGNLCNTINTLLSSIIPPKTDADNFTLGTWYGNGTSYGANTDFYLGELQFYSSNLADTDRQLIEGYLAWKWGLQASLPASHAYSTSKVTTGPAFTSGYSTTDVASWRDKSDNGLDLTWERVEAYRGESGGGNGNPTVYPTYSSTYLGGLYPGVNFSNGYNEAPYNTPVCALMSRKFSPSPVLSANRGDTTIFLVYYNPTTNSPFGGVFGLGPTNTFDNAQFSLISPFKDGSTSNYAYFGFGGNREENLYRKFTNNVTPGPQIYTITKLGSNITWYNYGTQQLATVDTDLISTLSSYFFALGVCPGTIGFTGYVSELMVYNYALNTTQRQQIEGYLGWKWGLQNALSLNNPYNGPGAVKPPSYIGPLSSGPIEWIDGADVNTMTLYQVSPSDLLLPYNIPQMAMWFDAYDSNQVTLQSGTSNVTGWKDKSGNGRDTAIVGSGTAPTYLSNGFVVNGQGYPGIKFNKGQFLATQAFTNLGSVLSSNSTDTTAFVVFNDLNTAGMNNALYGTNAGESYYSIVRNVTGKPYTVDFNYFMFSGYVIDEFNYVPAIQPQLYTFAKTPTSVSFYAYGNLQVTSNKTTTIGAGAGKRFNIGGNESLYDPYNSYISEVIIYNYALNTTQRQQIEGYLAWKWGLEGRLPSSGHLGSVTPPQLYTGPLSSGPIMWYDAADITTMTLEISDVSGLVLPSTIPGLSMWFDAYDDITITTTDGTTVTGWKDKSGNGRDTTIVGGGAAPTYSSNGFVVNGQGYPGIKFNSGQFLATQAFTSLGSVLSSNSTDTTAFVVFNDLNTGGMDNALCGTNNTGIDGYYGIRRNANGTTNRNFFMFSGYVIDNFNYTTSISQQLYTFAKTPTSVSFYAYGNLQVTSNKTSTLGTGAGNRFNIGMNESPATAVYNSYISEVIIYNRALSTAERQQVEGYLAQTWGMVGQLPADHPGRTTQPFLFRGPVSVAPIAWYDASDASTITNPGQIPTSGLQLWLDGADSTKVITSGGTVSSWNDKSGNGFNMNQIPTNSTNPTIGTPINGSNTVFFNATAGLKFGGELDNVKNFYWVGRIASISGGSDGYYFMLGHSVNYDWHSDPYPGGFMLNSQYCCNGIRAATPASLITSDPSASYANTFSNLKWPTAPSVSLISVAGITASSRYQGICFDRTIGNRGWCGDLGEVLIYSNALTLSQHQQVEGYLAWKWGIQANLPANHPYKNTISVQKWNDKSGNAYNLSLGGGTITYSNTALGASINLSGGFMFVNKPANLQNFALFTVLGSPRAVYDQPVVSGRPNSTVPSYNSTDGFGLYADSSGTPRLRLQTYTNTGGSNINTVSGTGVSPTALLPVIASYTGTDTGVVSSWINGNNGTITNTGQNRTISAQGFAIGAQWNGNAYENFISVTNLYEIVVMSNVPTTVQRQQMEGYLAWKWGLRANLPASHPYKTYTPIGPVPSYTTTNVINVADKSGYGNFLTSNSISYPTYDASAKGIFFGANEALSNRLVKIPPGYSMFAVTSLSYASSSARLVNIGTTDFNGGIGIDPQSNFVALIGNGTSWNNGTGAITPPTPMAVYPTRCIVELTFSGGTVYAPYFNGNTMSSIGSVGQITATGINFGTGVGPGFWPGYLHEFLLVSQLLTSGQRQQIEGYLAWKWNLSSQLPSGHPYRSASSVQPHAPTNRITALADKSGLGNNFTPVSVPNYPTYSSTYNGIYFGNSTSFVNASLAIPAGYTMMAVASLSTTPGSYGRLINVGRGDGVGFLGTYEGTRNFATFTGNGGWNDITSNTPASPVSTNPLLPSILEMTVCGTVLTPYFNASGMTTKVGTTISATGMIIGATANNGGQFWTGYLNEFLLFPQNLTVLQREQLEGYLAWKWGLQGNLPSTHPFKLGPP